MKLGITLFTILCISFPLLAKAKEKTIRISTSYKNLLSTPSGSGMLDKIATEGFRRIGIKSEIIYTSTKRSLVAVNDGLFDCELNRIEGMEHKFQNLIRVPEPNMRMQFVAFAQRNITISNWESLKGLKIGIVRGWKILERNTQGFPNITYQTEISSLFKMLHAKRLDVVLYAKLTGYEELKKMGIKDIRHIRPPLAEKDMYMYLHKKHKELVIPLAQAIREMKQDGTYAKIVQRATAQLSPSTK